MRTETEVDEVAGPVEARRPLGDLVGDQLHFQRLVHVLEEGDGIGAWNLLLHERGSLLDDLAHLRLDARQGFRLQPVLEGEVVVEAFVGRGADADDGARKEVQDGRRHYVRGRMTEGFQVFAHGSPLKGGADYTERVGTKGTRLDRPQPLQTGRDVFPAEDSVVERRLHVPVDLKHERELMRQGNDRRATGLTAKALLTAGVDCTATDAAVPGRCLLDGGFTSRTGADLERGSLLQTVSDHQTFPSIFYSGPCRDRSPLARY